MKINNKEWKSFSPSHFSLCSITFIYKMLWLLSWRRRLWLFVVWWRGKRVKKQQMNLFQSAPHPHPLGRSQLSPLVSCLSSLFHRFSSWIYFTCRAFFFVIVVSLLLLLARLVFIFPSILRCRFTFWCLVYAHSIYPKYCQWNLSWRRQQWAANVVLWMCRRAASRS